MTPAEFREARERRGLTLDGLRDELNRLGWPVSRSTVHGWTTRGPPDHVSVILRLMGPRAATAADEDVNAGPARRPATAS